MDDELEARLQKIEKLVSGRKKDKWEKLQVLIPLLIPVAIALAGWYFTSRHNSNQVEIQRINNDNQLQIALINSNVGQSGLIKDYMQHLIGKDTAARNIAIEAILYAAPTPGKRIVEIIARSGDNSTRDVAKDALASKRTDLTANLFSQQKQNRIIASNEISSNWQSDELLLVELLTKSDNCLTIKDSSPDCDEGVYNTMVVLLNFSTRLLSKHERAISQLIKKIPETNRKTLALASQLLKKFDKSGPTEGS